MNENEETFYAGYGIYGVRDKVTKKTIRLLDDFTLSTGESISKESVSELGRRRPYFRYVEFPVEVTEECKLLDLKGETNEGHQTACSG